MPQKLKTKKPAKHKQEEPEVKPSKAVIEKGKKTLKDMKDVLDKIDEVLEENPEEFVKAYIQKGGE